MPTDRRLPAEGVSNVRRYPWRLVRHDGWSRWERSVTWRSSRWYFERIVKGPTLPEFDGAREGDS